MTTNILLIVSSVLLAGLLFQPRVWRSRVWRATVTPLASIIGSGFLVAGPILTYAAGREAGIAMLGLCAIGYLYGAVMRHNILYVEPLLPDLPPAAAFVERASDAMLSLAYFVSVAYYVHLFAAFGLRLFDIESQIWIRIFTTGAISIIGAVGMFGGLRALERLEVGAVGLKLAVIGGLLCALSLALLAALSRHEPWPDFDHLSGFAQAQVLLGLIILVQGFETSRYLGDEYDAKLRVRTMRRAQWISTGIYVGFILLVTRLFGDGLPKVGGETEIIDMLRPLGSAAAPLLIIAALASQSSAAIADTNGAGGLLSEVTRKRVSVNFGNLATALAAIAITWSANIFEIITYASKAFVIYYALQSLQAAMSAFGKRRFVDAGAFLAGIAIALAVILFAIPAKA